MRTLEPPNRLRIGLMGIVVMIIVVAVGQSFTSVPMLFARPSYYGQFTDTGGLNKGDKVRIAGMDVGKVEELSIDGDHVKIKFSVGTNVIGTESRLAIRTDTILGKKVLEIEARGNQPLRPGGTLPLGQSTTPYQIYDAFFDVTKAATGWDIDTVKQSLHVLSQTIDQTYPHLSATLEGVAKFSDTIGKRDEEIKHLLAQANQVASILGDRSQQVDRLLVNAKTLIAAFNERGRAIDALLANVASFSAQVQGLINDNPNLNHVLEQLRQVSDILVERKDDLANGLLMVGGFLPSLNESIASGRSSRSSFTTWFRGRLFSRSSTPPSRSAAWTRRISGAAPACRNSGGPTRTAPGSPMARRRRRRGSWRARPSTRDRRSRQVRPARIRRPIRAAMSPSVTRGCRGRGTRCRVPGRSSVRSAVPTSRRRWMSRRHRRTRTACRRRRASRSRGGRATRRRTFRVPRCRCRRTRRRVRAPSNWRRPDRRRRRPRSRRGCRRVRRHRPGPGRSCPTPTSTQEARAAAV
ncbi:mce related family protein [Mycobacterium kansasii 732]|nr:mce related family protein [Mycobacterium kansasii 732]